MTIDTRLAEIRARVENATPGPWEWAAHTTVDGDKWAVFQGESTSALAMNNDGWAPDAELIAASRTDLPALLAAVEAVMKRAGRWTSLDKPEGDDFQGGFNAGVKFAAGHILRDITAELAANTTTTTREDPS